jgi:cupin fold WbuC family metalloprotein
VNCRQFADAVPRRVRPHHHHSLQWEMLVLLKGHGELLKFSEDGAVDGRIEMSAEAPVVEVPVGAWHGFVVREPDTAVIEVKPAPIDRTNSPTGRRLRGAHACLNLCDRWLASFTAQS